MKKIIAFAAAGLLTTATIVTATVRTEKKPTATKEVTIKKDAKADKATKCSKAVKIHHCVF